MTQRENRIYIYIGIAQSSEICKTFRIFLCMSLGWRANSFVQYYISSQGSLNSIMSRAGSIGNLGGWGAMLCR